MLNPGGGATYNPLKCLNFGMQQDTKKRSLVGSRTNPTKTMIKGTRVIGFLKFKPVSGWYFSIGNPDPRIQPAGYLNFSEFGQNLLISNIVAPHIVKGRINNIRKKPLGHGCTSDSQEVPLVILKDPGSPVTGQSQNTQDSLKTVPETSLSWECPRTAQDYPKTVPGLPQDCPKTVPGLPQDCPKTVPGLPQDCLSTLRFF
ncbi:hypothetical protein K435DRAFT_790106 [Dendrothele bispora CBS 962.96]|uniref:Uncharacterized protein n=1 Tax=Dendrothele bispora (strain CBS 962.96) TaxID=1314807 RepID=A0A4S8MR76_DENBC|nr:hypothetical protein K435DRAFT_790106 [Dendrothele bispora CBS 962.96]